jgi:hypothetical protein
MANTFLSDLEKYDKIMGTLNGFEVPKEIKKPIEDDDIIEDINKPLEDGVNIKPTPCRDDIKDNEKPLTDKIREEEENDNGKSDLSVD